MRHVTIKRPFEGHGMKVEARIPYAVEDGTLAHWLNLGIVIDLYTPEFTADNGPISLPGILLTRAGGFGDLLFLTPLVRAFEAQGKSVIVCCMKQYKDALSGLPNVRWMEYPMTCHDRATFHGRVIDLEGVVEFAERPETYMSDLFAEACGIELTDGRHLSFTVSEDAREWAAENFPRRPEFPKRVGIQTVASVPSRTYPHALMVETIQRLLQERGVEVLLFGNYKSIRTPDDPKKRNPGIQYVTESAKTFMDSAAVMETCDAFLGPDSSLVHIAGALDIPTVALYAAFPWQARTAHAKSILALRGNMRCAPCYWHAREGQFPKGQPCSKTGRCEAIAQIAPQRIVHEILRRLRK